jgi:DNA-binding MarR family transcriptional regulator
MSANWPHTSALNELMRECFRLNRGLMEASQLLTAGSGITGAQWGVLTAFGQPGKPATVAETARHMGLARQSVQRVADVLAEKDLVRYLPNSADRRAKLVEVTAAGRTLLRQLEERQRAWVDEIAGDYADAEIDSARDLVKQIRLRISGGAESFPASWLVEDAAKVKASPELA